MRTILVSLADDRYQPEPEQTRLAVNVNFPLIFVMVT